MGDECSPLQPHLVNKPSEDPCISQVVCIDRSAKEPHGWIRMDSVIVLSNNDGMARSIGSNPAVGKRSFPFASLS